LITRAEKFPPCVGIDSNKSNKEEAAQNDDNNWSIIPDEECAGDKESEHADYFDNEHGKNVAELREQETLSEGESETEHVCRCVCDVEFGWINEWVMLSLDG